MNALKRLLADNPRLYRFCKRYVDRFNNDNNNDARTNGELSFLAQALPHATVVFDVGANVGHWSARALALKPSIELHCFEPSAETFARLRSREWPASTVLNNTGLGASLGEATLHTFAPGSGMNSFYRRRGLEDGWGIETQSSAEKVRLDTLDAYCERRDVGTIDFLKVDVEGYELEVFKGARTMLEQRRIATIQFEYGGANIDARTFLRDIFEFFEPLPYAFYKIFPTALRRVPRYSQLYENFQYQNWAILSAEAQARLDPQGVVR